MIFQFLCQCKTTECITRCDLHNLALLLFLANQPVTVSILGKSMIYEKFPTPTRNRRTAFDCRFLLTRDKMTSQNINSVLIGGGLHTVWSPSVTTSRKKNAYKNCINLLVGQSKENDVVTYHQQLNLSLNPEKNDISKRVLWRQLAQNNFDFNLVENASS